LLATADASRKIIVRDAATGKPVGSPMAGSLAPIRALAFSPDDTLLASTGDDDTVRLWNVATSKEIWHSGEPDQDAIVNGAGDQKVVAFSTDGHVVLAAGAPEEKFAWDTASGRSLGNPRGGRNGSVEGLASPAVDHHVTVTQADAMRLWGISSAAGGPAVIDTVQGITMLAPGRDDQMLAVGNVSGAVQTLEHRPAAADWPDHPRARGRDRTARFRRRRPSVAQLRRENEPVAYAGRPSARHAGLRSGCPADEQCRLEKARRDGTHAGHLRRLLVSRV
jgi:hypothetical protein